MDHFCFRVHVNRSVLNDSVWNICTVIHIYFPFELILHHRKLCTIHKGTLRPHARWRDRLIMAVLLSFRNVADMIKGTLFYRFFVFLQLNSKAIENQYYFLLLFYWCKYIIVGVVVYSLWTKDVLHEYCWDLILSPFRFGKRSELRPVTEQDAGPVRNILNLY